jgi:predicted ester cyclase
MSEVNKAVLQRAIENFNDPQNREAYFQLYDANCILHGYQGVAPGLESIKQFYYQFWAAFPDIHLTIEDLLAEGDEVACRFAFRATHQGTLMGIAATGKQVTVAGITILRFTNGKCVERWSQADFLGMLQQLGAMPGS